MKPRIIKTFLITLLISGCAKNLINTKAADKIAGHCLQLVEPAILYFAHEGRKGYFLMPVSQRGFCLPTSVAEYQKNPEKWAIVPRPSDASDSSAQGRCGNQVIDILEPGTQFQISKIHKIRNFDVGTYWLEYAYLKSELTEGQEVNLSYSMVRDPTENENYEFSVNSDYVTYCSGP